MSELFAHSSGGRRRRRSRRSPSRLLPTRSSTRRTALWSLPARRAASRAATRSRTWSGPSRRRREVSRRKELEVDMWPNGIKSSWAVHYFGFVVANFLTWWLYYVCLVFSTNAKYNCTGCPLVEPVLPISHQSRQTKPEGGTTKIKANPTKVQDLRGHPVYLVLRAVSMDDHCTKSVGRAQYHRSQP